MFQIPVQETQIAPGLAYEWNLVLTGPAQRSAVPVSYSQARHFAAASAAAEPITFYIGGTFDLAGPVSLEELEAALLSLVRRHEVLRTHSYRHSDQGPVCDVQASDQIALKRTTVGPLDSSDQVRSYVHSRFAQVDSVHGPLVVLGALVRDDSVTVHFAYDHLVSDLVSSAVTVADICAALSPPVPRPPVGGYLDFAQEESELNHRIEAGSERLNHWRSFTARNGSFFPAFPLDLGVERGQWYASVNQVDQLLTGEETQELEDRCDGFLVGLLLAIAVAMREEGGPEVYRALMPLNRRGSGRYAGAVGWFVNAVPIEIPVPRDAGFDELLAGARAACQAAREHADLHYVRAWNLLAPVEDPKTGYRPVNFVSYLDLRTMPGAQNQAAQNAAVHLWSSGSNGIFLWFFRHHTGLYVNSLYADTPQARDTVAGFIRTLSRTSRAPRSLVLPANDPRNEQKPGATADLGLG